MNILRNFLFLQGFESIHKFVCIFCHSWRCQDSDPQPSLFPTHNTQIPWHSLLISALTNSFYRFLKYFSVWNKCITSVNFDYLLSLNKRKDVFELNLHLGSNKMVIKTKSFIGSLSCFAVINLITFGIWSYTPLRQVDWKTYMQPRKMITLLLVTKQRAKSCKNFYLLVVRLLLTFHQNEKHFENFVSLFQTIKKHVSFRW